MTSTILVTGAGGYIGSVATSLLLKEGYSVVAVDNFSTGFRGPINILTEEYGPEQLVLYHQDLREPLDEVFKSKPIDAVIHYAAHCSVNESMEQPEKYFSNNVGGMQNLLAAMIKHGVGKIVFSSTCAVYGETKTVPIVENHPCAPTNPYGASKKIAEELLGWYDQLRSIRSVALRYFNVCGATDDGTIGDAKKPSPHLMQNAVRGALGIEPFHLTCPTVDTPDGTPIRDYVNVVDLNLAHVKALQYLEKGGTSEIINIGTGTGNSALEIVEMVEKATGKSIEKRKGETRKGEYASMVAGTEKAKRLLAWEPQRNIAESIQSMLLWYTKQPHGWER